MRAAVCALALAAPAAAFGACFPFINYLSGEWAPRNVTLAKSSLLYLVPSIYTSHTPPKSSQLQETTTSASHLTVPRVLLTPPPLCSSCFAVMRCTVPRGVSPPRAVRVRAKPETSSEEEVDVSKLEWTPPIKSGARDEKFGCVATTKMDRITFHECRVFIVDL